MSKSGQDKGTSAADMTPQQAARQARLEEALRVNLRRRKAQSRGRKADSQATSTESGSQTHDKD
ncbi:MAG: hypothetical protein ABF335_02640 [Alphaproteobacteria bacterium]